MAEYKSFNRPDYKEIGRRIVGLRESFGYYITANPETGEEIHLMPFSGKRKISQEILIRYMKQEKLPTFSRNTLSKLEHGDDDSFAAATLAQWEALASVFNCSIGYLLGEYTAHDYNLQFIHDYTGLTEEALKQVIELKLRNKRNAFSDILSIILESSNLEFYLALCGYSIHTKSDTYKNANNGYARFTTDGMAWKLQTSSLADTVLQTHILQDLPSLADTYMSRFSETPTQKENRFKAFYNAEQQRLINEEVTTDQFQERIAQWYSE